MSENRQDMQTRAKWLRRLARDCGDLQIRSSLEEMASDLERSSRSGQFAPAAPGDGDSTQ